MEQLESNVLKNKSKTVLVTGATGMLGARLVFDLIEKGFTVRAIYRNKNRINQFKENIGYYTNKIDDFNSKIDWFEANVLDYSSLFPALEGIHIVYHCAAMVSFFPADKELMLETNINGTANLVNACLEKGVKKICHVSSIAALGKTENGELITEETAWIPEKKISGYSLSKFHSEMEIWRGINEGLEAVIVNPSVILGPGEWHTGSPAFFNNVNKGMKFYTTGVTGFVDVLDVSAAMIDLCSEENWEKSKSNRFLLNATNITYKELFTSIAQSLNVKAPTLNTNKILLGTAWRMAWLGGKLTGSKPLITKHSAASASKIQKFDGSKITKLTGFIYRPLEITIKEIGEMFLSSKTNI